MAIPTEIKNPLTGSPSPAVPSLDGRQPEAWHASAPAEVVTAYTAGEAQAGWEAWTDYLEARRDRSSSGQRLHRNAAGLLWGFPTSLVVGETKELVARLNQVGSLSRRHRRRLGDLAADWLDSSTVATASPLYAAECLAWAYALPQLPDTLGENLWWKLLNHLMAVARDAQTSGTSLSPLIWQMLAGELPLALATGLPEIRDCHGQTEPAVATIVTALQELLDADALPHDQIAPLLTALLACWTRSRALAAGLAENPWPETATRRYELALLHLARRETVVSRLWRAAAESADLKKSTRRLLRHLSKDPRGPKVLPGCENLPSPAFHSELQHRALLRPNWLRKSPRLEISYAETQPRIELSVGGEMLCSGIWQCEVALDGEARTPSGPWESVCWFSDSDVDFLEIEAQFGPDLLVQRQLLLAREDRVMLLADAIIADRSARIDYRSSLALCPHTGFHGVDETREGFLMGMKSRALVLPLALPEWRSDQRRGTLEVTSEGLSLRQSHEGRAAYAPLLVDLDRRRSQRPCTWRQATVGELRTAQANDVAVGFRGQFGKTNWLVYRSLADPRIRSFVGQQVKAEFMFARMKPDGSCVRLLEIESTDTANQA